VVVANEFGCRDERTFERLRDPHISDKEAFRKLIAREIVITRCTVTQSRVSPVRGGRRTIELLAHIHAAHSPAADIIPE
jgi:hypothetical protein